MREIKAKPYAVLRRWNDNPDDFEVVEYAATVGEAHEIIRSLPKSADCKYEVGEYEIGR